MNTQNIKLLQYDSQEIDFSVDKTLLTPNSKVFLQYKKEPSDSAVCSLEITPGESGNEWFPTVGQYAIIRWNVLPEHTLTSIDKITRFGYGLLLIDGAIRKTLSSGNILMFPSYNSPWIVKEQTKRIEKEIITATTDNQTTFQTSMIELSDELIVFVDSILNTDYNRVNLTTIELAIGVPIGTQVVIFSIVKNTQELPVNNTMLDMVDKAIFLASVDGQTDFSATFELSDELIVFVDSVLTVGFTKVDGYTIRLLAGVPVGTQVVIISPKTIGNAIFKPIENKQISQGDGKIAVYSVNPAVDTSGYFRYMDQEVLMASFDEQTDFEVTGFDLGDNLIVFVNFMVCNSYSVVDNSVVLEEGVSQGTVVIVYSVR